MKILNSGFIVYDMLCCRKITTLGNKEGQHSPRSIGLISGFLRYYVGHNTECKISLLAQSNFNRVIEIQIVSITSHHLADYLYVCILPQRNYISRESECWLSVKSQIYLSMAKPIIPQLQFCVFGFCKLRIQKFHAIVVGTASQAVLLK